MSGVKVGKIDSITPEGTQTKMTLKVDRGVPVPADAKAVIVAQNLVAARYVQLTPAYRERRRTDHGRRRGDSQRPDRRPRRVGRGQDPIDAPGNRIWGRRRARRTGCRAPRFPDSSTAPRTRWAATARSCGRRWLNCPAWRGSSPKAAATSSTSSRTCRSSSPRCATARSRSSCSRTGWPRLTSVLNDSRSDLDAALSDLSVAIGEVQRFVAGSRNQTAEQIQRLGNVTQVLVDNKLAFENVLHITPNAIANFNNIYYPNGGSVTGAFSLVNFSNPVQVICGMIGAVENTTAPETAKLCAQYLGPALRLLNFNEPSVADQRLPEAGDQSRTGSSTPTRSCARAAQGRVTRPSHRRRCPPTPARATSRRLRAGTGRRTPGRASMRPRSATTHRSIPSTCGDQPRAAARVRRTSSPTFLRRPPTVEGMLLPARPRHRRRTPNAPLLPAEGTPPS